MRLRNRPPDRTPAGADHDELAAIVMYMVEPDVPTPDRASVEPAPERPGAMLTRLRATRDRRARASPYVNRPRRGCPEEVLVTMAGGPAETMGGIAPGRLFERRIGRLEVDASSLRLHDDTLTWSATLRTAAWRRRRATLRVFGSTSTNVTVLTLTPERPHRHATRSFVRAGWPSLTELRDRIVGLRYDPRRGPRVDAGVP